MEKNKTSRISEFLSDDVACLDTAPCSEPSQSPEMGIGELLPTSFIEKKFNWLVAKLPILSAIALFVMSILVCLDAFGRLFFDFPLSGVTDIECLLMVFVGFCALPLSFTTRQNIQIDLFYNYFTPKVQRVLYLMAMLISAIALFLLAWRTGITAWGWNQSSGILEIPQKPFVFVTSIGFFITGLACLFQTMHIIKSLISYKEYLGMLIGFILVALVCSLPFIYRMSEISLDGLIIGGIAFALLMILMLLRIPLGILMCLLGILGLIAVARRPMAAIASIGSIPFLRSTDFVNIAFPMFMLMGEMIFLSGVSDDLFKVARNFFGRLPGGLAISSVAGSAGFGAVCGDSMATVVTMTSVALPPMRETGYDTSLATGALAAGGTLGILIPPSMGFIIYSMITEESVGKLFVAGVLPGILLTVIFCCIIAYIIIRDPSKAPRSAHVPLMEKLKSLILLIPVVIIFGVVVGGILYGFVTPGEAGAIGALLAAGFAIMRKKMTLKKFFAVYVRIANLWGKLFMLFVGLYVFGALLSASRLPNLLADFIVGIGANRYIVLFAVILLYIILGCVMNIIPMMMLTLPSIYPAITALGFDGVWFGVICVIVMEMGMITPPVGMNVFTLATLAPDIPMVRIFKGVLPFFVGMLICTLILILFPQIALFLPSLS